MKRLVYLLPLVGSLSLLVFTAVTWFSVAHAQQAPPEQPSGTVIGADVSLMTELSREVLDLNPLPLSGSFVANPDKSLTTNLSMDDFAPDPRPLTSPFVANDAGSMAANLSRRDLTPKPLPLTSAFRANDDSSLGSEVSVDEFTPNPELLTSAFVANADFQVVAGLLRAFPCGDQNNDGDVDVLDAIIDLQIVVGLTSPTQRQMRLSDVAPAVEPDGEINVFDVIRTLQHMVGLVETLHPCGPAP